MMHRLLTVNQYPNFLVTKTLQLIDLYYETIYILVVYEYCYFVYWMY